MHVYPEKSPSHTDLSDCRTTTAAVLKNSLAAATLRTTTSMKEKTVPVFQLKP